MYVHECMLISVDATFEINLLLNCCHIKQGLKKSDCGETSRKYCNVARMLKINIGKGGQIKKKGHCLLYMRYTWAKSLDW